jgi:hypothetical protein
MKLYNFKNGCNFFLKLWPSCNEVGNTSCSVFFVYKKCLVQPAVIIHIVPHYFFCFCQE